MKPYSFNFNPFLIITQDLLSYLDTRPEIKNWYLPFPGTVLLVSDIGLNELTHLLGARYPNEQFLLTETHARHAAGFMPSQVWDFIGNPRSSGRWEKGLAAALRS